MSYYDSETGHYALPAQDYSTLREAVIARYNTDAAAGGQAPVALDAEDAELRSEHAIIEFYDADHAIRWEVESGDRAVAQAHQTGMAQVLFDGLSKVDWAKAPPHMGGRSGYEGEDGTSVLRLGVGVGLTGHYGPVFRIGEDDGLGLDEDVALAFRF